MSILNYPSRKLFVLDLLEATAADGLTFDLCRGDVSKESSEGVRSWTCKRTECRFEVVWIQGVVSENKTDSGFVITDDSGSMKVDVTPGIIATGCPTASNGMYVMVIGQLVDENDGRVVSAIKMQDLSNDLALEHLWPYEVRSLPWT